MHNYIKRNYVFFQPLRTKRNDCKQLGIISHSVIIYWCGKQIYFQKAVMGCILKSKNKKGAFQKVLVKFLKKLRWRMLIKCSIRNLSSIQNWSTNDNKLWVKVMNCSKKALSRCLTEPMSIPKVNLGEKYFTRVYHIKSYVKQFNCR